MTSTGPMTCADFDAVADELAVGALGEPMRSRLLDHAAGCGRCGTLLNELSSVADELLAFGPEIEPPTGFETGTVARMQPPNPAPRRRWIRSGPRVLVVAAVLIVTLLAGGVIGRVTSGSPGAAVDRGSRQGAILSATGVRVGTVAVLSQPRPHVVIALDRPKPSPGDRTCQLEMPNGAWVSVGSWSYAEIGSGVWAVGIDHGMLGAVAMRIQDDGGDVVATAQLS